jgi:4-carboxymuconolactone decarboxylase
MKMSNEKELTGAQKMIGAFAPKLVELTDDVLFGDVWERKELSSRDRSLITVASLITGGNTEQRFGRGIKHAAAAVHIRNAEEDI